MFPLYPILAFLISLTSCAEKGGFCATQPQKDLLAMLDILLKAVYDGNPLVQGVLRQPKKTTYA